MELNQFLNRYCSRKTRARLALIYKDKQWLPDAEWVDDCRDKVFEITGGGTVIRINRCDSIDLLSHISTSPVPKSEIKDFVTYNFIECAAADERTIKINIDGCKCFAFTMKAGDNIGLVDDDKVNWLFD